jgi:hypothetical protein
MSQQAVQRVHSNFRWADVVATIDELYADVIARTRGAVERPLLVPLAEAKDAPRLIWPPDESSTDEIRA